jgi:hypothetical protein
MIRRLRQVHRVAFVFLALVIPVLMTRALASRPADPRPPLPAVGAVGAAGGMATWSTALGPIRYRVVPPRSAAEPASVELAPVTPLRAPDLLLYWSHRAGPLTAIEGEDRLLGRLDGGPPVAIRLPAGASDSAGTLVLYSLGHQAIVGSLSLGPARGALP